MVAMATARCVGNGVKTMSTNITYRRVVVYKPRLLALYRRRGASQAVSRWEEGRVLGYAHERVALDAQELVEVELAVAVEVRLHEEPPHARHVASLGLGLGLGGLR